MTSACRLYLITPAKFDDLADFARLLEETLAAGDVAALQVRLKDQPDTEVLAALSVLKPITLRHGVALILNDRPDLALQAGCDGVHIGQQDMPYRDARQIMGPEAMIGVTCHNSRDLAMDAAEAGADYVAFGAFFPSSTKDAATRAEPEILSIWQAMVETPCVAIGGITVETAEGLAAAGADFLAVSAGVWSHIEGPAKAVVAFNSAMARGVATRPTLPS